MTVISVDVPEFIARKFSSYSVVKWSDLSMEEQLLNLDGDGWETIVNFGKGVNAKEVLSYLEK